MKKSHLLLTFLLCFMLGVSFVIPIFTKQASAEWIVDGDTVYVDDDMVYASATPHTINGDDEVVFEFESKQYTGDVDFAWGFNQTEIKPTDIWLWQNYSHENYYHEEQEDYGCTMVENVTSYESLGIENYSSYNIYLGNSNNTYLYNVTTDANNSRIYAFSEYTNYGDDWELCGNYNHSVKVWNNQTYFDWKQWDVEIEHINWQHQGTTDWYITPQQPIVQDTTYKVKVAMKRQHWSLEPIEGKYWFAFKPSSETLSEAQNNGHLYTLDPWYSGSWDYRKEITLDHDQVPSTQTNFPVCINITDTDLRDHAQSDGDDIVFTEDSDNKLNHEIELYNSTNGQLVAWVNITSLAHDTNTSIYMYYGNDGASNQENVVDTWDSDYIAVYHLSNLLDSTSNNNDLSNVGGATSDVGIVGDCYRFDGVNDYLTASAFIGGYDNVTLETFANRDSAAYDEDREAILHERNDNAEQVMIWTIDRDGDSDKELEFYHERDDIASYILGNTYSPQFVPKDKGWFYTSFSAERNSNMFAYMNGTQVGSDTVTDSDMTFDSANTDDNFDIGAKGSFSNNNFFDGVVDEVRVSTNIRSDDWIETTYNSMINATDGGFFTLGSEETSKIWQTLDSGYFTFDTEDRNYQTIDEGSFTFTTEDRTFQTVQSGYFTFDTIDRAFITVEEGYFTFDTIDRQYHTIDEGGFTFTTTDRSIQTIDSGSFSFRTARIPEWRNIDSGWFSFTTEYQGITLEINTSETLTPAFDTYITYEQYWHNDSDGVIASGNYRSGSRFFLERGAVEFNISHLSTEATIHNLSMTVYCFDRSFSGTSGWVRFRNLSHQPTDSSTTELYNDIMSGGWDNDYFWSYYYYDDYPAFGNFTWSDESGYLDNPVTDLQNAVDSGQGWFGIGSAVRGAYWGEGFWEFASLEHPSHPPMRLTINYTDTVFVYADFNYTINGSTVTFEDTTPYGFGEHWSWDFNDGSFTSGRYGEHKNPTHKYTIDWDNINQSVDYVTFDVTHEVCSGDLNNCTSITKPIRLERPESAVDDEITINIPTTLILAVFVVLVVIALISVFIDQSKDVLNGGKRR